jgi:uncharacterized protein
MSSVAPVSGGERIASIDVLRGFALLGILLMNIQDFGLPGAAYSNPTLWGGADGANLGYWFANQVFFEGKMRTIFSMLFGAGFLVLASRAAARGPEARADLADIYYRRTWWLMLFGALHAVFIWWGDILFPYAVCGLLLYVLRNLSARTLILTGTLLLVPAIPRTYFEAKDFQQMREKGEAALKAEKGGKKLTKEQEDAKKAWEEKKKDVLPDPKKIQKDVNEHRTGYWNFFKIRADGVWKNLPQGIFTWIPWDCGSMMLIGMGLFKLGVFTAGLPLSQYVKMVLAGYGLGVPVLAYVAWVTMQEKWDPLAPFWWGWCVYDYGRLTVALGHIGVVMILCQKGWLQFLTRCLAAVGQTALSNYLLTSILMTFFFNGYGLGQFGHLQRHQLLYVAAGMWTINLVISPIWLRHFRFGPMEWVWRSLTYWKKQPMRLLPVAAPSSEAVLTESANA